MPLLTGEIWAYVLLGAVLVIAAVQDVRTHKIRNWVTYPAIAAGLIGHTLLGGVYGVTSESGAVEAYGLIHSLMGLAVGFGPLLVAWLAGGIGGGDAKLMAAVGALLGWRLTLECMFFGFAVAGVMALVVMIRRRILLQTLGRLWRFFWLALSPGRPADPATPESPKLPFGLALCIGSGIALVRQLVLWELGG